MKRLSGILIMAVACVFLSASLTGCASLRKKITPKKKDTKEDTGYYRVQDYNITPSLDLYTKHYIMWKCWTKELLQVLGQNSKKDIMCIEQIIGNLQSMKTMLVDEKGDELQKHIDRLMNTRKDIMTKDLSTSLKTRIERTVQKEYKLVKINFSYRKVGPLISEKFRRDEVRDNSMQVQDITPDNIPEAGKDDDE